MPFDFYCPSVIADLEKRVCIQCGLYFPSQAAKRNHSRVHRLAAVSTQSENADVDLAESESVSALLSTASTTATESSEDATGGSDDATGSSDDGLPVVRNLFDWLQSAFVEEQ